MDSLSAPSAPETAVTSSDSAAPAPLAQPLVPPLVDYRGNKYDLYALLAGTLGGTWLAICFTFNMAWYCVPVVPLVLGIVALRNSRTAVDESRTRNLAWLGIAGGGLGTLLTLCFIAFLILYFGVIFAAVVSAIQSAPKR